MDDMDVWTIFALHVICDSASFLSLCGLNSTHQSLHRSRETPMNSEILIPPGKNHQQKSWVLPQQKSWVLPQQKSWVLPQQKSWVFLDPKNPGFFFFCGDFWVGWFWGHGAVPGVHGHAPMAALGGSVPLRSTWCQRGAIDRCPGRPATFTGWTAGGGGSGKDGMDEMDERWRNLWFFFQTFVGLVGRIILQPFQFSAPWDIFFFGGPFFWCVLSLSVWSLFAGYPTADRWCSVPRAAALPASEQATKDTGSGGVSGSGFCVGGYKLHYSQLIWCINKLCKDIRRVHLYMSIHKSWSFFPGPFPG